MRLGSLALLLLIPFWAMLLHALVCRVGRIRARPRQSVAIATSLFTALLVSGAVTLWDGGGVPELLFSLFAGVLLAHIYFHIFNMSETARRIRLLIEIREGFQSPGADPYTPRQMFAVRLARLREFGQVELIGDRYFARSSWLLWAADALRRHERLLFPTRFRK